MLIPFTPKLIVMRVAELAAGREERMVPHGGEELPTAPPGMCRLEW